MGDCPRHCAGLGQDHRTTPFPLLPVRAETLEDDARCAKVPHPSVGESSGQSDGHFSDITGRLSSGEGRGGRNFHHPQALEEEKLQMASA